MTAPDPGAAAGDQPASARILAQVTELLVRLIDIARPGAAVRGRRLADEAVRLAARFEVPAQFLGELELAARLHEVGAVVVPSSSGAGPWIEDAHWRRSIVTRSVLEQVDELRGVASLIEAMSEHWDGSGHPGRFQRGQIPFRARLLRVLVDYLAELDEAPAGSARGPNSAAAALQAHANTIYDPAIVSQLVAMVSGDGEAGPASMVLPVSELAAGMVLAEDLCTSSGIMLLAAGARLTQSSLAVIQRRHLSDPVLTGAMVRRVGS